MDVDCSCCYDVVFGFTENAKNKHIIFHNTIEEWEDIVCALLFPYTAAAAAVTPFECQLKCHVTLVIRY